MGRWQPDARDRLERAALELFAEQGFAATTVPQITARAGLTTRTYFRHFADKREVLFGAEDGLPEMVAMMMAEAPAGLAPMALIEQGLDEVAAVRFTGQLDQLRTRRAVIASDDGLQERELRKLSGLTEAIRHGFLGRGEDDLTATLAAHLASTVFSVALTRWLDSQGDVPLPELLHETLRVIRTVAAEPCWLTVAPVAQG